MKFFNNQVKKPKCFNLFYNTQFKTIINKVFPSSFEALKDVHSNSSIMIGGFGTCGFPENLVRVVINRDDLKDLVIISSNGGIPNWGIGPLIKQKKIKQLVASYIGENPLLESEYLSGNMEINFIPQGTLAEKIRNGGAGIPAFYTPTGVDTLVETGGIPIRIKCNDSSHTPSIVSSPKKTTIFNGRKYILEESLTADVSFIKAYKGDTMGNLVFHKTARNFNMDMAKAGKLCVAEVEEIVEAGKLNPDDIHCPGIYVNRIVKGELYEKPIEHLREAGKIDERAGDKKKLRIARRAAEEIEPGMYVNLGIGIPNLVTEFLKPEDNIKIHTENGMIGLGHYPEFGKEDADLISALKEPGTETPGCSYFCSSQSFSIVRGRHLDMSILGSFEVSQQGDISNWIIPGKKVKGMGGAMDLVSTGKKIIITMEHCSRSGKFKIVENNRMPFTGKNVVSKLITEMAVFEFDEKGIILTELFEDSNIDEIKKKTECKFRISENIRINNY